MVDCVTIYSCTTVASISFLAHFGPLARTLTIVILNLSRVQLTPFVILVTRRGLECYSGGQMVDKRRYAHGQFCFDSMTRE